MKCAEDLPKKKRRGASLSKPTRRGFTWPGASSRTLSNWCSGVCGHPPCLQRQQLRDVQAQVLARRVCTIVGFLHQSSPPSHRAGQHWPAQTHTRSRLMLPNPGLDLPAKICSLGSSNH